MEFRTQIPLQKSKNAIDYNSKIIALGSCFAVNMAQKLKDVQFQTVVNPFGILFHPKAIENFLQYAVDNYEFSEEDVFCYRDIWSCYDAHSDLNQLSETEIVDKLNSALQNFIFDVSHATHVILTFGTSWVYQTKNEQKIVANCHKLPQDQFQKRILSFDELLISYRTIFNLIKKLNPNISVIFTISPVRHIKDGFVENQRSKANLIGALHQFLEELDVNESNYFPSYEIVMDELRDYRFYKQDMLHPNAVAIDYIWKCFVETMIDKEAYPIMKKVDEVQKGLNHRPFNPTSEQHLLFLDSLVNKIDFLLDRFPFMNFR